MGSIRKSNWTQVENLKKMELLKLATNWAKAEMFSSSFFILFGIVFVIGSIGFWQLGKTDIAKAYVVPFLVAGSLLLIIGTGLVFNNMSRVNSFTTDHNTNSSAFLDSEIKRAQDTMQEYKTVVFTGIPIIIALCALVLLFVKVPIWRASMITTIAMLVVILLIDGTAHGRLEIYLEQLLSLVKK